MLQTNSMIILLRLYDDILSYIHKFDRWTARTETSDLNNTFVILTFLQNNAMAWFKDIFQFFFFH